jgi:NAD(P)H-dependent flavin oxidoreductase YrpB (nitropropane dioxygenase family)
MTSEGTMTSTPGWLYTSFCERAGVRYPIVQTGMGWVSGASLTAATSAAGGLGILAAVTLDADAMIAAVGRVQSRTTEPFGVNVRPDQPDLPARLEALAAAGVAVVSFAGAPAAQAIKSVHDAGQLCVVTVGRPRHAEKMVAAGVDVLIAQGAEGGGHTGDVPTSLLLPAVVDAAAGSGVPVLAAGGFHDGRGLAAAIAWGADGVAMGTRFLMTQESHVPSAVKSRYTQAGSGDAVVSTAFDGRPMRVLRNEALAQVTQTSWWRRMVAAPSNALAVKRMTGQSWAQTVAEGLAMRRREGMSFTQVARAADAPMMIKAALVDGDPIGGVLPSGQVVGSIGDEPSVAELVERIMAEAAQAGARLAPSEVRSGG